MKALVVADNETDLRVAHALAGEGEAVSVLGGVKSRYPTVTDPRGFDVVLGRTARVLEIAEQAGAAAVTADEVDSSPVPTVAGASLLGAGLAMAARMEAGGADVLRVAIAHPGGPSIGGVAISFPPPVGRSRAAVLLEEPLKVMAASTQDPWAAIVVEATTGDQAVVDEYRFLSAICLAAGVALIPPAGIVNVWDVPDIYLAKAEQMGLVGAQRGAS
ncbi:MAG: hypothetical protein ACRDWH_09580 [Acidimicrobiia bacterium]